MVKYGFNELKGEKVYSPGSEVPWGVLSDVVLDKKSGRVFAYLVKTLSLVPVCRLVKISDVKMAERRIEINKNLLVENYSNGKTNQNSNAVQSEKIKRAVLPGGKAVKIKNMHFDIETGEISDAVILKNIISGPQTVSVNKISVKDNTICVENFLKEE